jgi:hypothetical protein
MTRPTTTSTVGGGLAPATRIVRLERNLHRQKVVCGYGIAFLCRRCRIPRDLAGRRAPRLAGLSLDLADRGDSYARARTGRRGGESTATPSRGYQPMIA